MPPKRRVKALILVRTYPTPARNGVEVSCTAAVTEDGQWLRLFPVPYRFLGLTDQRFRKYQWIDSTLRKRAMADRKATDEQIVTKSKPYQTFYPRQATGNNARIMCTRLKGIACAALGG